MKTLNRPMLAVLAILCWSCAKAAEFAEKQSQKRVAIIGGGISGSFAAKYLADFDDECLLDITIFKPPDGLAENQGSRVSSMDLNDGTTVELGASIIFEGNKLVNEMIDGDGDLMKVEPHSSLPLGEECVEKCRKDGMGIYDGGDIDKPFPLLLANMTSVEKRNALLWRYNLDLWRINRATMKALDSFKRIYDLLESMDESSFFSSPNDVWRAVGLDHPASLSFESYLDEIGVSSGSSWWRSLISGQGVMRSELYTAMNICNNNQVNTQMTGLAGLVNSVAATGKLFAVKGGNENLIFSAFRQAKRKHDSVCERKDLYGESKIKVVPELIKSIVADFENKIELLNGSGKVVGTYDVVILAAPLQFSGIDFLGRDSNFDDNVLHALSLNEMVHKSSNTIDHQHRNTLRSHLPSSATRPYTQVITTYISNANINTTYFSLDKDRIPGSILFTERGREMTGISSIGQIHGNLFKIFSSEELSANKISEIFGKDAKIEYVKVWGGKNGGATPAFNGGGESSYSTRFMLYDGHGANGSSIYYTNAMEAAVSAIEISAIGSKFVSKLVANRLGLIHQTVAKYQEEL